MPTELSRESRLLFFIGRWALGKMVVRGSILFVLLFGFGFLKKIKLHSVRPLNLAVGIRLGLFRSGDL